jgi:aminomethyltransferase
VSEVAHKKTPLYDEHMRLGARMVPFAGWLMPVQYTSIVEEHQAVRNNVGIFDISHMGQFIVDGADTHVWLNCMLTNNVDKLDVGTGQYTFLLNDRGGIIDDLIVYRIAEQKYLLVVNAARADEDFAWLKDHLKEGRSPDRPSGGLETAAPWYSSSSRSSASQNCEVCERSSKSL